MAHTERREGGGPEPRGIPREPHVHQGEEHARERERRAHPQQRGHGAPIGRVETDQPALERDADADQEPPTPHHHGRDGRPLDAEPGKGPHTRDQERVEPDRQQHRRGEQRERRARVARRPERRLDREEPEHERAAEQPRVEVVGPECGHLVRHGHQAEQVAGEREPEQRRGRARAQGVQYGRAGGARGKVGAALSLPARGDRNQPHLHHLAQRQQHPDVESRGRDGRERRRADEPPYPDGVDQVEAEMAGHHRHGGGGELQDDGAQRPDGERSGHADGAGHGATNYRSAAPGVNDGARGAPLVRRRGGAPASDGSARPAAARSRSSRCESPDRTAGTPSCPSAA